MVTIIYLKDNGESQVANHIVDIARMGNQRDSNARVLARYIRKGLAQLTKVGVASNKQLMMTSEEDNGDLRTFNLLKPLTSRYPLNEFRINRSTPGAFRAIFFECDYEGEQFIVFIESVLKQGDSNPPEFQMAMRESEALYVKIYENPTFYLGEDD